MVKNPELLACVRGACYWLRSRELSLSALLGGRVKVFQQQVSASHLQTESVPIAAFYRAALHREFRPVDIRLRGCQGPNARHRWRWTLPRSGNRANDSQDRLCERRSEVPYWKEWYIVDTSGVKCHPQVQSIWWNHPHRKS